MGYETLNSMLCHPKQNIELVVFKNIFCAMVEDFLKIRFEAPRRFYFDYVLLLFEYSSYIPHTNTLCCL